MRLINKISTFFFICLIYFHMHNKYLLEYFRYLTDVKRLEFTYWGLSFLVYTSLIVLTKRERNDGFQIVYNLLDIVFFAPILTYLSFTHYISIYFYVSLAISLLIYKYNIGKIQVKFAPLITRKFVDIFAVITLLVAVVFVSKFEFNLNASKIYEIRETYADKTPGVLRYVVFWSAYFSAPYLFLRFIYDVGANRVMSSLIFLVTQLLLFSIGNNKSFLVIYFIIMSYVLLDRKKLKSINLEVLVKFPRYYLLLLGLLYGIVVIQPSLYIVASFLFLRTVSLAPRQLDLYYSFIHDLERPLTFLAQNWPFRWFLSYPHDDVLGKVVSRSVLGIDSNANAAFLFSDGIAGFGIYLGPIISMTLLNCVLSLVMINPHNNHKVRVLLAIPFVIQVLNTSVFTTVITGGGLLIMLLGLTQYETNKD